MAAMKCPNCGGPVQVAPGQTTVACTFCGSSVAAGPPAGMPPPPASPYGASPYGPPPPAWGPPPASQIPQQIVVVAPGQSYQAPVAAAATFMGMRLLFGLLPVVITLFVAGIIAWTSMRATGATTGLSLGGLGGWNGSTPLLCGGNDEMQLSGITASFSAGSALNVSGNCHVTCQGCTLRAPVVVAAGGNAQIDLVDCHLEGAEAVVAGGNAQVRFAGNSTVVGKITQGGNASVTGAPSAATAPTAAAAPTPKPKPTVTSGPSPAAPSHGPSKPH